MSRARLIATVGVTLSLGGAGVAVATALTSGGHAASVRSSVIGHSVRGRPIVVRALGAEAGRRRVLVVGCLHGNERAGEAVTRDLRRARAPRDATLLLLDEANPDGCRAGTRQNAHGVDLNRNSRWRWQRHGRPWDTYYPGPAALSEPESRVIRRFILRNRPVITIWYHQQARVVDESGGDPAVERRYARLVGLPFRRLERHHGSIASWQNAAFRGTTSFVVELPAGALSPRAVARHRAAVLALASGRP